MGEFSELGKNLLEAAMRFRGRKDKPLPITEKPASYDAQVWVDESNGRPEWVVHSHGVEAKVFTVDYSIDSDSLSLYPIRAFAPIAIIDFTPGNEKGSELPNRAKRTERLVDGVQGLHDLFYLWDSHDPDGQGMPTPTAILANGTNDSMAAFSVSRLGFQPLPGLTEEQAKELGPYSSYSNAHLRFEALTRNSAQLSRLNERAAQNRQSSLPTVSGGSGLEE